MFARLKASQVLPAWEGRTPASFNMVFLLKASYRLEQITISQAYHIAHSCKQRRREKQRQGLDSLYDAFSIRNCENLSIRIIALII